MGVGPNPCSEKGPKVKFKRLVLRGANTTSSGPRLRFSSFCLTTRHPYLRSKGEWTRPLGKVVRLITPSIVVLNPTLFRPESGTWLDTRGPFNDRDPVRRKEDPVAIQVGHGSTPSSFPGWKDPFTLGCVWNPHLDPTQSRGWQSTSVIVVEGNVRPDTISYLHESGVDRVPSKRYVPSFVDRLSNGEKTKISTDTGVYEYTLTLRGVCLSLVI